MPYSTQKKGNLSFHAQSTAAQGGCKEALVTPVCRYLLCAMALFMIWYVVEADFNSLMPAGDKGVTHAQPAALFKYVLPFCYHQALRGWAGDGGGASSLLAPMCAYIQRYRSQRPFCKILHGP